MRKSSIVKRKDDEMAETLKSDQAYQTSLARPPGPTAYADDNFFTLPSCKRRAPRLADWPPTIHLPREMKQGSCC